MGCDGFLAVLSYADIILTFKDGNCNCVRTFVLQIEQGRLQEKEAAAKALAKQVAEATLAQIRALVESDTEILKSKLPGPTEQATENALDMKYLRDRQATLI